MHIKILGTLFLATLLAACSTNQPPAATPGNTPTAIDSFGANPNPSPLNVGVSFSWTVTGSNLTCTLDAEGDGTVDYTVQDCTSQSRVVHTYGTQGAFTARLDVKGADGKTLQKTTPVSVSAPNTPPTIPSLTPAPPPSSSNDPLAVRFTWVVADFDADITRCRFDADSDGVWDFDDLCSGLPANASVGRASLTTFTYTYLYRKAGRYEATLEAADPYVSTRTTVKVRVPWNLAPEIEMLKATAGSDFTGSVGFTVSDPDHDPLNCILSVQSIGTFRYSKCATLTRSFDFGQPGTYRITLEVSDGQASRSKSVSLTLRNGPPPPEPAKFVQIAAGDNVSCAVTDVGAIYCWGDQLNAIVPRVAIPTRKSSVANPYAQVSVGGSVFCALDTLGLAYCWGGNAYGQLGNGTNGSGFYSLEPVAVTMPTAAGFTKFTQITAGRNHVCALGDDYKAYCWGINAYFQLGDTTNTDRNVPTAVAGGLLFKQISTHPIGATNCGIRYEAPVSIQNLAVKPAVSNDGKLYCWGGGTDGQIGNGSSSNKSTPTEVSGSRRYKQLSNAGLSNCALDTSNDIYCWGSSESELGNGSNYSNTPVKVANTPTAGSFSNYTRVMSGEDMTCMYGNDLALYCKGRNWDGQLGIGSFSDYNTLVTVPGPVTLPNDAGLTRFVQVSVGSYHACAVGDNMVVYCWGTNNTGQLGVGDETRRNLPTSIVLPLVTPANKHISEP